MQKAIHDWRATYADDRSAGRVRRRGRRRPGRQRRRTPTRAGRGRAVVGALPRTPRTGRGHPRGAAPGRLRPRDTGRGGLGYSRVEAKVEPGNERLAPGRHPRRPPPRGRAPRRARHGRPRRDHVIRRAGPAGERPAAHRAHGVPRAPQLLPPPQARDQPAARPRPRRARADLPAHLQARLGPPRRRGRGGRVSARSGRARDRGGARARPSTPATCCSPTGSLPGAAGTTRSASSSTAASTTRASSTRWSSSPARSGTRSSPRLEQVRERCADFTARRIASALAVASGEARPAYVESGG